MAEVDKTSVSIRFSGEGLNPEEIGSSLRFKESEKTESTINTLKSGKVVWVITYLNQETIPLEKKIEELLVLFTNDINIWNEVTGIAKADIFCGLFLDGWNKGFELSPNTMRKLSDRKLKIGFDIYAPTDSWYKFTEESNHV